MSGVPQEQMTMSLAEFLQLPEQDEQGNHFELDEGRLITLSPAGRPHGQRVAAITYYLYGLLKETAFQVVTGEVGILMALDPKATVRGMDVAVLEKTEDPEPGMIRTAPRLIVEVISPSNDPVDLERKRRQYQLFGVDEIWFVYDDIKSIHVYRRDGGVAVYDWPGQFASTIPGVVIDTREVFR